MQAYSCYFLFCSFRKKKKYDVQLRSSNSAMEMTSLNREDDDKPIDTSMVMSLCPQGHDTQSGKSI